jgi:aryl carrier-like protein
MGWVHRYKHRGAVLALTALALQIALTFGHFI